jgi:hypothetical protein
VYSGDETAREYRIKLLSSSISVNTLMLEVQHNFPVHNPEKNKPEGDNRPIFTDTPEINHRS